MQLRPTPTSEQQPQPAQVLGYQASEPLQRQRRRFWQCAIAALLLILLPLFLAAAFHFLYGARMLFKEYPILSQIGRWGAWLKVAAAAAYLLAWLHVIRAANAGRRRFITIAAPRSAA